MEYPQIIMRPLWWWRRDTEAVEVMSALCAGYWAFMLALPTDYFASQPNGPLSMYLAVIMPEWAWACAFGVVWLFQSMAMCGNITAFRAPAAVLALVFWGMIAGFLFMGNPQAPAVGVYGLLSLSNAWVLISRGRANVG